MIELELCTRPAFGVPPPAASSSRAGEIRRLFGLAREKRDGASSGSSRHEPAPPNVVVPIPMPGIVFITGPSGGGKSTILEALAERCLERGLNVVRFDRLPDAAASPERPLIDILGESLEEASSLLALAGLSDAHLMLRAPEQLSDGERWRLRLALAMDLARRQAGTTAIIADEFAAALDRTTAMAIARNMRRWIDRAGPCAPTLICATSHDDVLEALWPDVLVWKSFGDEIEVLTR